MEAEREVKVATPRVRTYETLSDRALSVQLDPLASPFYPTRPPNCDQRTERDSTLKKEDATAMSTLLRDGLSLSRLPVPEPSVFTGATLGYVRWKISFKTLIENKGLSPAERTFYLQRYLGGKVLKTVEAYFFNTTEQSYAAAWKLLDERYGHNFNIQEAFRDKLSKWRRVANRDATGMQEYADFLNTCRNAMSQIPGLQLRLQRKPEIGKQATRVGSRTVE